jgi:hypothetical protein
VKEQDVENIERYEQKFLVSPRESDEVRRLIAPYCQPDRATRGGPYQVMSLYLDGEHLPLYKSTRTGDSVRLKLRARTYGSGSVYLEIKRKVRGMIWKSRACITDDVWRALFQDRSTTRQAQRDYLSSLSPSEAKTYREFSYWRDRYQATPQVWVDYSREGYQSLDESYARVTFDTQLRGAPPRGYMLPNALIDHQRGLRWRHLDYGDKLKSRRADVVIELKSERSVPDWMSELSRHLNHGAVGVSKYGLAIEHIHSGFLIKQRGHIRELVPSTRLRRSADSSMAPDERWR